MDKIYLQMYSFGEFEPEKTKEHLKAAADMGFSGVELFGPDLATDAKTMKGWLADYGLEAISLHTDTDKIVSLIPYARELGLKFAGIGMAYLPDEAAILSYASRLNEIGRQCRENGLTLTYHNHTQE